MTPIEDLPFAYQLIYRSMSHAIVAACGRQSQSMTVLGTLFLSIDQHLEIPKTLSNQ